MNKIKLSLAKRGIRDPLRVWGSRHLHTAGSLVRCVWLLEWQDKRCFNSNLTILDFEAIKRSSRMSELTDPT